MAEIFLIASETEPVDVLSDRLAKTLASVAAPVLLIKVGTVSDADYLDRVAPLLTIAQKAGCAVLLDDRPHLVRQADADGVHMSGGIKTLREAIADLKPDFIVGTGDIGSRHEAMSRGELDLDYLMFGDRDDVDGRDMAQWWAETFEVPCVYRALPDDGDLGALKSEFIAVSDWTLLASMTVTA